MKNRVTGIEFTSSLSPVQTRLVLGYLPVHLVILPLVLNSIFGGGKYSAGTVNLAYYVIGIAFMLLSCFSFLRRDFDPLCDRPLIVMLQVAGSYLTMMACNLLVAMIISIVMPVDNPNNAAVVSMAGMDYRTTVVFTVFLAPIVEEMLFRAGIFGTVMKYNRTAAYIASVAAFSIYHVWAYALVDLKMTIYIIQYIPVSFLLCMCYERTNTIWTSIFFHMLVNGISMKALTILGAM